MMISFVTSLTRLFAPRAPRFVRHRILLPKDEDKKKEESAMEEVIVSPRLDETPTYSTNPFSVLEGGEASTSAFSLIQGSTPKKEKSKEERKVKASPVTVGKKRKGRRGSKSVCDDAALLEMIISNQSVWQKHKAAIISFVVLLFAALALFIGGFHQESQPNSTMYDLSADPLPWDVSVLSPVAGGVLNNHLAPLTWKMTGSAISPGSKVSIEILLDSASVQSDSISLPLDATDEVTGTLDLPLPSSLLRGTHNITVKCDLGDLEAVSSSVFLFMPSARSSSITDQATSPPQSSQPQSEDGAFDPSKIQLDILQPAPGAVVNGDSMVLKFDTLGFDTTSPFVKVVLILDGDLEFQLTQNVQTISGLALGSHSIQLFCILKSDQSILSSSSINWTNAEISPDPEGLTVDGKRLEEVSNAMLIELADAKGISTSVRLRIVEELDNRFEEYQKQYYA